MLHSVCGSGGLAPFRHHLLLITHLSYIPLKNKILSIYYSPSFNTSFVLISICCYQNRRLPVVSSKLNLDEKTFIVVESHKVIRSPFTSLPFMYHISLMLTSTSSPSLLLATSVISFAILACVVPATSM